MDFKDRLVNYFKAGYPALAITTSEEQRAVVEIKAAADAAGMEMVVWDSIQGAKEWSTGESLGKEALEEMCAVNPNDRSWPKSRKVYVLLDTQLFPLNENPILNRAVKSFVLWCATKPSTIIFLGESFKPPASFAKYVTMVDYSLPSEADIVKLVETAESSIQDKDPNYEIEDVPAVTRAALGMSKTEVENALLLSYVEQGRVEPAVIYREKVSAIKRSGLLELIDPDPLGIEGIGGLDNVKEYVLQRKAAFSPEAKAYGLPVPRGCLMCGLPGTGKSLSAKAMGTILGIPTLRMDIGALFGSLVGDSERRTREALQLAEMVAPVVVFVDEVEKALAGAKGSSEGDSGVSKRVFGTILSWMQDRTAPVFVVLTANQVNLLPPEFLRAGRLDAVFHVDAPNRKEREAIFSIHLKKRKRDPSKFDIPVLVEASETFVGAEIEETVISAMYAAFDEGREVETADILAACKKLIPLSKTMEKDINALKEWAKNRTRPASKPEVVVERAGRELV